MMTKEARLLKQANAAIKSATDMLEGHTVDSIEYQTIRNAANQAMQACVDLHELLGMKNKAAE